jgi:transcriptional antiterminator NusG
MKLERPKITTDFTVGEKVKVIDGALEGFIGDITAVDLTAGKCKVDVAMFGRVTPVDLDFGQIARIE